MSKLPNDPEIRSESEHEQLLANAVAEYVDLRNSEVPVNIDDYCSRHSGIEQALREQLESMDHIDDVLDSIAVLEPSHIQAEPREQLPAKLSGHTIMRELGSGGMGRVLLAYDESLERDVAIKILHTRYRENQQIKTRFIQEARAMAKLTHPHIVRIYTGPSEEVPHFVMEYVKGTNLTDAARPLRLRERVELMVKVIRAVDVLHQHRILHRDLKPGNILVGADLEPKVLDFGLAQSVNEQGNVLTGAGDIIGTPDYFSPEQARGDLSLDARSDIFALGTVLYELLTGTAPFRAGSMSEQLDRICNHDPLLPRRINSAVPGDLQNVCLKALEKNPIDRYSSAREMADDLERYLAGESVLANPTTYSRLMAGKVESHLRELDGWKQDNIVSEQEFNSLRKLYGRLFEKEDAWILEVRRLTIGQVALYLGAWILVIGAALVFLFKYSSLDGTRAVLLVAGATLPTAYFGIRCWHQRLIRIAIAYLLAFCLLLPTTLLLSFVEWQLFADLTRGDRHLELFPNTTNAQLWWALLLSFPAYIALRRYTRATVFSLVAAVGLALFCFTTLLRLGLLNTEPDWFYVRLIPIGALFLILGITIERLRCPADSRYFYPLALISIFFTFTGLAATKEPNAVWLEQIAPFTRGQHEYLFIINAVYYLVLQFLADGFGSSQMRTVSAVFRFVIPGHVMTSLLFLGVTATERWQGDLQNPSLRLEARTFEILLPAVACVFVFGSLSKQMKNYLALGLIFLAIGVVRLQLNLFEDRAVWPISLLVSGTILMFLAANYPSIRLSLKNLTNRFFKGE